MSETSNTQTKVEVTLELCLEQIRSEWGRIGLVGLVMTLEGIEADALEHIVARIEDTRIELSFRELEEGLAELLHAAYPLVDGVLDPPAWRDASGGRLDEAVRLSAQRRLVGSFWRHSKSRELVHGARGQLSALRVRDQATPIAKKVRAKQLRARWCHVPEWVMPGVQTRHAALKSTEWRVDPEEYLAALFAPLACPTRRISDNQRNRTALLVPAFGQDESLRARAEQLRPLVCEFGPALEELEDFGELRGRAHIFGEAPWRSHGDARVRVIDVPVVSTRWSQHDWTPLLELAKTLGYRSSTQLLTAPMRQRGGSGWDWLEVEGSSARVREEYRLRIWSVEGVTHWEAAPIESDSLYAWRPAGELAGLLGYETAQAMHHARSRGMATWLESSEKRAGEWRVRLDCEIMELDPTGHEWTSVEHLAKVMGVQSGTLHTWVSKGKLEERGVERRRIHVGEVVIPRTKKVPERWLWRLLEG